MPKKLVFSVYVEDDYTDEEIKQVVYDVERSVEYAEGAAQLLSFEGVEEVEE